MDEKVSSNKHHRKALAETTDSTTGSSDIDSAESSAFSANSLTVV